MGIGSLFCFNEDRRLIDDERERLSLIGLTDAI
jgi:hypothetical protein